MARLGECEGMFSGEQEVVQACKELQKRCVKELAELMRHPKKYSRSITNLSPEDEQTLKKMKVRCGGAVRAHQSPSVPRPGLPAQGPGCGLGTGGQG